MRCRNWYTEKRSSAALQPSDSGRLQHHQTLPLDFSASGGKGSLDAVGWAAGRASGLYKTEWWGAGVVICLERGADLHTAQLMPLPLTVSCFSKIQIGLPFWYRLTWVVPEKGPLNGCVCVCVWREGRWEKIKTERV